MFMPGHYNTYELHIILFIHPSIINCGDAHANHLVTMFHIFHFLGEAFMLVTMCYSISLLLKVQTSILRLIHVLIPLIN